MELNTKNYHIVQYYIYGLYIYYISKPQTAGEHLHLRRLKNTCIYCATACAKHTLIGPPGVASILLEALRPCAAGPQRLLHQRDTSTRRGSVTAVTQALVLQEYNLCLLCVLYYTVTCMRTRCG